MIYPVVLTSRPISLAKYQTNDYIPADTNTFPQLTLLTMFITDFLRFSYIGLNLLVSRTLQHDNRVRTS